MVDRAMLGKLAAQLLVVARFVRHEAAFAADVLAHDRSDSIIIASWVVVSDIAVPVGDRRITLVLFIETDPGAIDQRSGGEPTRVSVCPVMGEPKEIQSLTSPANAGEGADLRAASAPGRRLASRLYGIGADDLLR